MRFGFASTLKSLTVYDLIHYAAAFEFGVIAVTFTLVVCILSLRAALFMVTITMDHAFPGWRDCVRRSGIRPTTKAP